MKWLLSCASLALCLAIACEVTGQVPCCPPPVPSFCPPAPMPAPVPPPAICPPMPAPAVCPPMPAPVPAPHCNNCPPAPLCHPHCMHWPRPVPQATMTTMVAAPLPPPVSLPTIVIGHCANGHCR